MRVWRLVKRRHLRTVFSGAGARLHGGRWHHAGTAVVYTSESLSLAALELLVNTDSDLVPGDVVSIDAEIPERVRLRRVLPAQLPRNWRTYPAPRGTRDLGADWLQSGESVALVVPSVVVPEEHNILLNPAHADFAKLKIGRSKPFRFDSRLVKQP